MIRPTPKQKQAFRRAAHSRGRLYLQTQLPWLNGFPIAQTDEQVLFIVLSPHEEKRPFQVTVGRAALHNATYASKRLTQRLPHVLVGLVDDPLAWRHGVPRLIQMLKTAVHHGQPLPQFLHDIADFYPSKTSRQFEATLERQPQLHPLLAALSWTLALSPAALPAALEWVEQQQAALTLLLAHQPEPDGIVTALMLWQLVQADGNRRLAPLLRWFANPLTYTIPTADSEELLNQWVRGLQSKKQIGKLQTYDKRPSDTSFGGLYHLLHWLHGLDKNARRRALTLFELLFEPALLEDWDAWWQMVDPCFEAALQLDGERQYVPQGKISTLKIKTAVEQLVAVRQKRPTHLNWRALHLNLPVVTDANNSKLYQAIVALLSLMPERYERYPTRLPLFLLFQALDKPHQRARLIKLLTLWKRYRQQNRTSEADLYLLRTVFVRWHQGGYTPYWTFLSRFFRREMPPVVLIETFQAWSLCQVDLSPERLEELDQELIVNLQQTTRSVLQTAVYYNALLAANLHEAYYERKQFIVAHALSCETADFLKLLKVLHKLSSRSYSDFAKVGDLLLLLATQGWRELAHDSVLTPDHLALLVQIAVLRHALAQMKEPTPLPIHPIPSATPAWCSRYPARFHPLLAALATLTPEAETRAERILGKQFLNAELVQQEIEAIATKLAEGDHPQPERLKKRLANLRRRLVGQTAVSPRKLANLEKKLLQQLHHTLLLRWHDALVERIQIKLRDLFELELLPDWFWQSKQLEIIAPMLDLTPAFRSLGIRLFRERTQPRPWGLRDHPANQTFIAKMEKKGLDMTAWLTPLLPQTFTAPTGQAVTLALCDDPLEVFHMGSHFRTCLSAGAFNFFSVFANAADVNKQVLYGRNTKGQVVGRCLLALTDSGAILTFEPYSHDPKLNFRDMVKTWVLALSERMSSPILPSGRVSTLVATDWYDDGSIDIAQQFEFLEEDSFFRQGLRELPLANFLPLIEEQFAPLPLNGFTLPLVLGLAELQKRPELVVPLLPAVVACKQLPTHVLIRTASLAHAAGERPFARQIMQELSLTPIIEAYRLYEWLDHPTMLGLAQFAPSTTLKVLRRTRPSKVRRDLDETHPHRVEQYAVAYETLGRPSRAAGMRQRLKALQSQ